MGNLLNHTDRKEILSRIDKLTPDSQPLWGQMNVNQALRHMVMCFDIATGMIDPTVVKGHGMPKWLMKFLLLNMKPPKEKAETFKEVNMVANNIEPESFEEEVRDLKVVIEAYSHATEVIPENKLAGKFNKNDWGKLNYTHVDHHLRQFGV